MRHRGGHHASPVLAVTGDRPAELLGKSPGFGLPVDPTDRLRGLLEGWVGGVDLHLGQQGCDFSTRDRVRDLALQEVADHALGLRPEHVERDRLCGGGAAVEAREDADLRSVAVCEHDLVRLGHPSDRCGCHPGVFELSFGGGLLTALQERVPSEGEDDPRSLSG